MHTATGKSFFNWMGKVGHLPATHFDDALVLLLPWKNAYCSIKQYLFCMNAKQCNRRNVQSALIYLFPFPWKKLKKSMLNFICYVAVLEASSDMSTVSQGNQEPKQITHLIGPRSSI